MQLVHQTKDKDGNLTPTWEVAWVWIPHFIASNPDIVKHVSEKMTESFKGRTVKNGLQQEMHQTVIELILEKLPMPGLKDYLEAVQLVKPEEEL